MIVTSFESELLQFLVVRRFSLCGTSYDHDKCQHIMPKNYYLKKLVTF